MKLQRSGSLASYLSLGVGGAAVASSASAAIITYNGPVLTADVGMVFYWDPINMTAGLEGGGTDRFRIINAGPDYVYTSKSVTTINTYLGLAGAPFTGGNVPAKLASGATIDANTLWFGNSWAYMDRDGWTTAQSPWATGQDGTRGYIPFSFYYNASSENKYYGWADVTYNDVANTVVLNNFAYNDTPNAAITTGGGPAPVPEPATVVSGILLLAMGGAKVLVARRRRNGKQTAEPVA